MFTSILMTLRACYLIFLSSSFLNMTKRENIGFPVGGRRLLKEQNSKHDSQ
jgi:hypothetical protein